MTRGHLKELELRVRRFYLRQRQRPFRGELVTSACSVLPTATPRILLLRQDRIGDVLCSTPILDTLRRAFPHAQMDIVLGKNNIALADVSDTGVITFGATQNRLHRFSTCAVCSDACSTMLQLI